jgi:hypothetical protein
MMYALAVVQMITTFFTLICADLFLWAYAVEEIRKRK